MANIKSQKKRNRQNVKRYDRNKAVRSELKTREHTTIVAAESGDVELAEAHLRETQKRIDMAMSKGILHANTGARRKSRLTRRVRLIIG